MTKMTLSEELSWRGFVNQTTYKDPSALDGAPISFYWGVDPSASSMTIGNLAMAMMVKHFIAHGHKAYLLVGGATGLIGDPDGKNDERELKSIEEISADKSSISNQYKQVFSELPFEIVDNYDWFKDIGYLDFLRDIGKHMPMRQMLGRDFVQTRLSEGGSGISYAEFSYSLIQGYDFLQLFREKGVSLQVCGSDQWGNSIAGVDLIRRIAGGEAHVWSAPLILNKSTGEKFGKTEAGAIWLNPNLTSVFEFYQFWLNVDDDGVEDYLKVYTLLVRHELDSLMQEFNSNKSERKAQKSLAYEVTKIVHGAERADSARSATGALFGDGNFLELDGDSQEMLSKELPNSTVAEDIFQTIVNTGLANSKSEARTFVNNGAVSVNGQKLSGDNQQPFQSGPNLVKRGKNSFAIINN